MLEKGRTGWKGNCGEGCNRGDMKLQRRPRIGLPVPLRYLEKRPLPIQVETNCFDVTKDRVYVTKRP